MNVNDIYEIVKFAIKKNQNGNITPVNFNRLINLAQHEYVAYLLGNFQTYQPGRPIAQVELGNNRTVRTRLTPVIYGYILNVNAGTGISQYPGDYIQTDSMYSIYGVKRIRFIEQNQLDSAYNSVINPIATNPIYLIKDIGFQFYPTTIWQARLSYVRDAPDIHWGSTDDINGRPIYDASLSVDPVFDDAAILEIIVRCLALVGVNLQLGVVMQYANQIKQVGQ